MTTYTNISDTLNPESLALALFGAGPGGAPGSNSGELIYSVGAAGTFHVYGSNFQLSGNNLTGSTGDISHMTHFDSNGVVLSTFTDVNLTLAEMQAAAGGSGGGYGSIFPAFAFLRDDSIVGNGGAERFVGGPGDDIIQGGGGNDVLYGGSGSSLSQGEPDGPDYGDTNTLYGNSGIDVIFGGSGTDHIYGGADQDSVYGEAGNDFFYFAPGDVLLVADPQAAIFGGVGGGAGIDTIVAGGTNSFFVSTGLYEHITSIEALTLDHTLGADTTNDATFGWIQVGGPSGGALSSTLAIAGDAGATDTVRFVSIGGQISNAGSASIFDGSGFTFSNWSAGDRILIDSTAWPGNAASVTVTGTSQADEIISGIGSDTISGLGGNDTITGGLGADALSGGTGNDTFIAIAADLVAGESIDGGADTDTLRIDGGGTVSLAGVTLTNLERITLTNTAGTRLVVANAAQAALVFSAAGAADTVAISSFGFWGDFSTLSNLKALHTAGVENVEWNEGGATNIARMVGGTTVITSTDTAGAEWKTGVLTFGTDDKITSWVVEFDDGRVRTTTFADGKPSSETTTDPLNAQPWSSITRTWDANGVLSQEVIAYESGFTQTQNLVDGVRTEYKLEDTGNTAAWTSLSYHYNPAGQLTSFDTLADNGIHQATAYLGGVKTTHTTTDTLNIAAFDKEVQTFDAAGTSLTQREVTLDKGAAPLGDTFIETYANGQLQKYEYYDLDNSDTITSVVDIYQAGVLQTHTIDYDTGPTWVFGSAIDQTLTSTSADEYLWGRAGADTFVFAPGNGTDRIMDFDDGVDKIDLTAYGIHSKADIDPSAITEPYGHLTIDLGGGNSLKIIGFSIAQFSDADFV